MTLHLIPNKKTLFLPISSSAQTPISLVAGDDSSFDREYKPHDKSRLIFIDAERLRRLLIQEMETRNDEMQILPTGEHPVLLQLEKDEKTNDKVTDEDSKKLKDRSREQRKQEVMMMMDTEL
ncbi:unnamed protein product [Vicia faba]|uniref:Uncharacterized protein n=1 Tax=Vicia faba TaxID=3906 RepID=A0AAV1AR21_VICFA|nr:unnamed protein product [Vicia faba]